MGTSQYQILKWLSQNHGGKGTEFLWSISDAMTVTLDNA